MRRIPRPSVFLPPSPSSLSLCCVVHRDSLNLVPSLSPDPTPGKYPFRGLGKRGRALRNLARRRKGGGRRANAILFFHLGAEEEEEEPFFLPFVGKRGKGGKRLNWCRDEGKGRKGKGTKTDSSWGKRIVCPSSLSHPPSFSFCLWRWRREERRGWCGRPVWDSTLFHRAREENVTEQNNVTIWGKIGVINLKVLSNLALLAEGDDSDKVVLGASWNWDGLVGLWGAWQGIIFHRRRRRQRQKNRAGESSSSSSFPTKGGKGVFGTGTHKEKTASI